MNQVFWINDLSGGQNQHTAPGLLNENQTQINLNSSQSQDGSVSHRLGTELYLDLIAGDGPVQGLHMYNKGDGTYYFHSVMNGDLMVGNEVNSEWDVQSAGVVFATSKVSFTNFIDRHYFIGDGATDYLKYATETGAATQVSGPISGKYVASNGAYLMVAGDSSRKNYWSNLASDTFTTASDFVYTQTPATGVVAFGNNKPFIVFTTDDFTIIDPSTGYTERVDGFGCESIRSIINLRGYLIWPSRRGETYYMLGPNDAYPSDIGLTNKNDITKNAFINRIVGSNWTESAAGVKSNRALWSFGDLSSTVRGQTLDDAALEMDFAQQNWRSQSFSAGGIGSVFAEFINSSGEIDLYAGSRDNNAVYKLEVEDVYTDDDSTGTPQTVTGVMRSKHYVVQDSKTKEVSLKRFHALHFKYKSAGTVAVKYSLDGNTTYTPLGNGLPQTTGGVQSYDYKYAVMPLGKEGKTISIELSYTGQCDIHAIGFEVEGKDTHGLATI